MVKIADILYDTIINTENYLKDTDIWNDEIKVIFNKLRFFLDIRREYENLGWKRFCKYKLMSKLIEEFSKANDALRLTILKSIVRHAKDSKDIKTYYRILDGAALVSINFRKFHSCIINNNYEELNNLTVFKVVFKRKETSEPLPRSGQAIKFP
jgi:hypothetical protein